MPSILIAPNSFKGCINSVDLTRKIEEKISVLLPKADLILKPISDGGDGFLKVCNYYFNLDIIYIEVLLFNTKERIQVPIGIDKINRIGYLESANVIGLVLAKGENDPCTYSTFGLGNLLYSLSNINLSEKYFDKLIIGIGGTATADLGLGICDYFDFKAKIDGEEAEIIPKNFHKFTEFISSDINLSFSIEIVTDVNNKLLGENGAIYCFGKQKGIKDKDLEIFENGFKNILSLLKISNDQIEGLSGAGGGIATGFQLFFNAKVISSEDFIFNTLQLNNINPDFVVTGEGSFDSQSILNKGAYLILNYFKDKKVKNLFLISGKSNDIRLKIDNLSTIFLETFFDNIEESIKNIDEGISEAAKLIVNKILLGNKMENQFEQIEKKTVIDLDEILGKPFKVLNDGFVRVVDYMGNDESIVQAARVSYGKGTKKLNEDKSLIRYLLRHRHTTPFEMCELKLHIRVPMDTWRQWIRHRTASVNEYSTRYSIAIDSMQTTDPEEWRGQAKWNKQGSEGFFDIETGKELTEEETLLHKSVRDIYNKRIEMGVAREQARKDLPLSTYTEAYWKVDLHNLLHFLELRMEKHAQAEIREYATIIGNEIVKKWVPIAWQAFNDYVFNSKTFSRYEMEVITCLLKGDKDGAIAVAKETGWLEYNEKGLKANIERAEFESKLEGLGVSLPW